MSDWPNGRLVGPDHRCVPNGMRRDSACIGTEVPILQVSRYALSSAVGAALPPQSPPQPACRSCLDHREFFHSFKAPLHFVVCRRTVRWIPISGTYSEPFS